MKSERLVTIDRDACRRDGICSAVCPVDLFVADPDGTPVFRAAGNKRCMECGHCVAACPHDAIDHLSIHRADSPVIDAGLALPAAAAVQLLKSRRSVRQFRSEPVPHELMAKFVDTARWAPTARNRQEVHWLVLRDPAAVRLLAGLTVEWLRQDTELGGQYAGFVSAWEEGEDRVLRGAPHLVVAHGPTDWHGSAVDCTIALNYFELAAVAHGVGTCWAGFLTRAAACYAPLQEALALPEGHRAFGALMFGYPKYCYRRIPQRREARVEWR